LPAPDPEQPEHLDRARELFRQIGATHYLQQLD
jgi:hypothetical protein